MVFRKGHRHSPETLEKLRTSHLGNPGYWTGKHRSEETKKKLSMIFKGKYVNEKHPFWKGDKVCNKGLHMWVRKNLAQPKLCEFCNERHSMHLANITGVYNRNLSNWKYLCVSCHKKFDLMRLGKLKQCLDIQI